METSNRHSVCVVFLVCACIVINSVSCSSQQPDVCAKDAPCPGPGGDGRVCQADTFYFEEPLNHFGFSDQRTFQLRYLLADQHWTKDGAPIFFYTGNELDIELLCENTGFMWDIAPEFGAMVVFAEHRYYGKTMPLGPDTLKNVTNFEWLTTEQALADYARLIAHIKKTIPGAEHSPVIAFGGSYAAMLAAYMRITYPHLVLGAHSSSAPFYMLSGKADCKAVVDVTTRTFEKASPECVKNIRQSFDVMQYMATQAGGLGSISRTFNLCTPLTDFKDVQTFFMMLGKLYLDYAMMDYPYPTNYLSSLPAWPVNAACEFLSEPLQGDDLLVGVAKVVNMFFNYTGDRKCLDFKNPTTTMEMFQFEYQVCTELVMPICSDGSGMFFKLPWSWEANSDQCYAKYGVRPRPDWTLLHYRMTALDTTSNIIFTNGDLDPCSSGGILEDVSDTVVSINIENAAHHLELRSESDLDPPAVVAARKQIKEIFRKWLGV